MTVGDGTFGIVATSHLTKALKFLRRDLANFNHATTEATLSVISAFSMFSFVLGDIASAENHIQGLFRVVTMRGGLRSLKANRHLQTKCCRLVSQFLVSHLHAAKSNCRIDLGFAMSTCSKPLFFADGDISWNSYLPRSASAPQNTAVHLLCGDSDPDPRMVNIWLDLYEFSRAANIATQTRRKLETDLLQEVMISVQYRLSHAEYDNDDVHELLRIVLLAYSTIIFPSIFCHFGVPPISYPSLSKCLDGVLIKFKKPSKNISKVLLWLLVIIRIQVLDNALIEDQLFQTVQALNLTSWDEILPILKGFLWVDVLHEEKARCIFEGTPSCIISR